MTRELELFVWNLMKSLDEANADCLMAIANNSEAGYDIVAKAAIHYERLGDPDVPAVLYDLVLRLEELEEANPGIRPKESIVRRLMGPLAGWQSKEKENAGLSEKAKQQHEYRMGVVQILLSEISDKRAIKVTGPLLAATQDATIKKTAEALLDGILRKKFGTANIQHLKEIIIIITAILAAPPSDKVQEYAEKIALKIIEENENPLIYWVRPMLGIMVRSIFGERYAGGLLDRILEKRLGNGDEETITGLVKTVVATMGLDRTTEKQIGYAVRIAEKLIDDGEIPLIYFIGPLLAAMQNPAQKNTAVAILCKIRNMIAHGRTLGNADKETVDKTRRTIVAAACGHLGYAGFFRQIMETEDTWYTAQSYGSPAWQQKRMELYMPPKEPRRRQTR